MRYSEIIGESILTEGADLNCGTCGEYLGKDTECDNPQYCGTCGDSTPNPRGTPVRRAPTKPTATVKAVSPKDAHRASRAAQYSTTVGDNTWALIDDVVYRTSSATGQSVAVGKVKSTRVKLGGVTQDGFSAYRGDGSKRLFTDQKQAVSWVRSIDVRRTKAAAKK